MHLARFGILVAAVIVLLSSSARSADWIDDRVHAIVGMIAALIGLFSIASLMLQKGERRPTSEAAIDDEGHWPCIACGYDVRHLPERCPECGTLVPPHRRPLDPRKMREDWPRSPLTPREPGLDEPLVRVWDAPNGFAASLFIEQLKAHGIKGVLQRRVPTMRVGEYVTPAALHAVFVYQHDSDATSALMTRLSREVVAPQSPAEAGASLSVAARS